MEKNRENLLQAIAGLPEYHPPDGLWQSMEEQLDLDQILEKPLSEMPVYAPPTALWAELEASMEQVPELRPKPRTGLVSKWWILALLGSGMAVGLWIWSLPNNNPAQVQPNLPVEPAQPAANKPMAQVTTPKQAATPTPKIPRSTVKRSAQPQVTHHTEVVDDVLLMACQQADDPNYGLIETLCREALPVCEEPQFKHLKAELDDLTRAHTELKNALGNFANDPEMVAQLVEIERSRNQILQQLITMM